MKSKVQFIITIGIVLVLLIGAAVALKLTAPKEEEQEDTAAEEVKTSLLFDKKPEDITLLTIKNETSEYVVQREGKDGIYMWLVFEYLYVPMDYSFINTLIQNAATLTAQETVDENAPDLSIYGLDAPAAEYTVEFDDSSKTVKNICIGSSVPGSSKVYMCYKGENTVYTVNASDVNCFMQDKSACVEKTVYTAKTAQSEDDTTDYTRVNRISVSRKDIDYDIVIEYDTRQEEHSDSVFANSSNHRVTSPVTLDINPEKGNAVTGNIFGLAADSFAVLTPTDEQKAEYGFDDPYAVFEFDIAGEVFTLTVGNGYDDENYGKSRYVMASGIDVIYCFAESKLPWLTVMPLDITTTMITGNYIYGVSSIDVSGSENAHFDVSGDKDTFAVKMDGVEVDGEKFKKLYQFILRTPAEQLCFDEPEGEPALTVAIKSETGDDTLEFFPSADRRTVIRFNGVTSFSCKTAFLDRLTENFAHFKNGEDIVENW